MELANVLTSPLLDYSCSFHNLKLTNNWITRFIADLLLTAEKSTVEQLQRILVKAADAANGDLVSFEQCRNSGRRGPIVSEVWLMKKN